jgi:hypothetical protein
VVETYFGSNLLNYHKVRRITTIGWDRNDFLPGVGDSNVFYVHTHGNDEFFWMDTNDYHYDRLGSPGPPDNAYAEIAPPSDLHGFALKPTRVTANGSGLPPFNSTGIPPVNLAFVDSCTTGTTNSFALAFLYPYGNSYTPPLSSEDQAEVGYNITKETEQTRRCNDAFWGALEDGKTVNRARFELFQAYEGTNEPAFATDLLHVWGDFYMRLKGVYTGSEFPTLQTDWWRIE